VLAASLAAMACSSHNQAAKDAAGGNDAPGKDAAGGGDATADATPDAGRDGAPDGGGDVMADRFLGCVLDASYTFTTSHGINPRTETGRLTPPAAFTYENRTPYADAGNGSCTPALPACNTAGVVDVADIVADLADPDVQQALAQTTSVSYGAIGGADLDNFSFQRGDGRGFGQYGPECSPASAICMPTPAGVHQLLADLRALVTEALADPSCAGLH